MLLFSQPKLFIRTTAATDFNLQCFNGVGWATKSQSICEFIFDFFYLLFSAPVDMYIPMDIHKKSADMDMDMDTDRKFYMHGNPEC